MIPRKVGIFLRISIIGGGCFLLLAYAPTAAYAFGEAIQLCGRRLLPSVFPFMVLCNLLPVPTESAQAVSCKTDWATYMLYLFSAWLGGYLVCANLLARWQRNGSIDISISSRFLLLGCCSGPGFVVGYLGLQLLGNQRLGWLLYFSQLAANFLSTALFALFLPALTKVPIHHSAPLAIAKPGTSTFCNDSPFATVDSNGILTKLAQAIGKAAESCLPLCGCVLFYHTFCSVLLAGMCPSAGMRALLSGCFEITSGCASFAALGGRAALYGICLCLSFLGISVFSQMAYFVHDKRGIILLVANRLLHLPILIGVLRLCLRFIPGVETAWASMQPAPTLIALRRSPLDAAFVLFILICCILYKLRGFSYNKSIR